MMVASYAGLGEGMDRSEKRLHICLGTGCNNNCIFCVEDDRESRKRRLTQIDEATARRILEAPDSRKEIMFTAGEPTLRGDLLSLVRYARGLGYRQIGIITNGRRLAYSSYAEELVRSGINYVLVSIHGHNARLHDSFTRTPGSFEQTVEGLRNLASLREMHRLKLVTTTVLNKRNMGFVSDLVGFLRSFGPDQVVFNCIQPVGRGERYFKGLVPRYTELVASFRAGLGRLESSEGIYLLDVPRCVSSVLPRAVVGYVELHRHFEPSNELVPGAEARGGAEGVEGNGNGLTLVTKEKMDGLLRTKGPECPACSFGAVCDGVWKAYVAHFGFDEFRPLRGVSEEACA